MTAIGWFLLGFITGPVVVGLVLRKLVIALGAELAAQAGRATARTD